MPDEFSEQSEVQLENSDTSTRKAPRSRTDSGLAFFVGLALLGVLIYFGIAQGMAALVMFPGIPLVLLWFVYWFFLRRLIRMRHIRSVRERRLLREAAERSRER